MGRKITIFTSTNCAYCGMVKKWLAAKSIPFTEVNIDKHPNRQQEAIKLSGAMTVPITLIENNDKKDVVVGYNLSRLASAIAV